MPPSPPPPVPPATRSHQVLDRQHGGMVASVFEHPDGWLAESAVVWRFQNVSFPMTSRAVVRDPSSPAAFEFLPTESFFWLGEMTYGPGEEVLGQISMPPTDAAQTLAGHVVPRHRRQHADLRLTGSGPMPQLVDALRAELRGAPGEGAWVRIEYAEAGEAIEEELYGLKSVHEAPFHGPLGAMTQVNWFLRPFSFRARKGELETRRDVFWKIALSVRVNPQWESLYQSVTAQLKAQFDQYIAMGYSQIQAAGEISRAVSAQNDAMLRGFEQQRLAARSARTAGGPAGRRSSADRFSDYIRGVETVEDPYWGESQQDANFEYHWTDGFGRTRSSNDPSFDPNIGSSQTWTRMKKKP